MKKKLKKLKKQSKPSIRDIIAEEYSGEPLLFMTEKVYDAAIIGVMNGAGKFPAIAYDYNKVIEINVKMGMTYEEAIEYFDHNQIGAYMGDYTPVFIYPKNSFKF